MILKCKKNLINLSTSLLTTLLLMFCSSTKTNRVVKIGNYSGDFYLVLKKDREKFEAEIQVENSKVYSNDRTIGCNFNLKDGSYQTDTTILFIGFDLTGKKIGNCTMWIKDSMNLILQFDRNYLNLSSCNQIIDFHSESYLEFEDK